MSSIRSYQQAIFPERLDSTIAGRSGRKAFWSFSVSRLESRWSRTWAVHCGVGTRTVVRKGDGEVDAGPSQGRRPNASGAGQGVPRRTGADRGGIGPRRGPRLRTGQRLARAQPGGIRIGPSPNPPTSSRSVDHRQLPTHTHLQVTAGDARRAYVSFRRPKRDQVRQVVGVSEPGAEQFRFLHG